MGNPVKTVIIGCGGMGRHHIRQMLKQTDTTQITAICDISEKSYAQAAELFVQAGHKPPPNQPDLAKLLNEYPLDTAFIVTPHACHHDQTVACLEKGLDVLLEKPMAMTAAEARSLIEARDRTRKLLVVAFPGSLSPQIRSAVKILRSGEAGNLLTISATAWQDWGPNTANTWRQQPEISGGGFLFDTGAHMLNTVVDLAGEEFVEIAAWMDNFGRPVETLSVVIGRLKSGALVSLHGCGEAIPSCNSDIRIFCSKAIIQTGIWGETLKLQRAGARIARKVAVPPSLGVWEQFIAVRGGEMPNPCPPEVGLRMAKLYDAIKKSAALQGQPVAC